MRYDDLGHAPHVRNTVVSAGTTIDLDQLARVLTAKTAQRFGGVPEPVRPSAPAAPDLWRRRLARPVLRALRAIAT